MSTKIPLKEIERVKRPKIESPSSVTYMFYCITLVEILIDFLHLFCTTFITTIVEKKTSQNSQKLVKT